jgi:DNA-binding MarR family transcriptional regulator
VSLAGADAYTALRRAMAQAGLAGQSLRTEERLGWWVYWPPLDDPVRQVQALAAIDRAGVKDVAPIRQGPMARAISLGMFASEADASRHRENLQRKGLSELRHGPRPGIRAVYLDLTAAERDKLTALRRSLPEGVSLEEVACPG